MTRDSDCIHGKIVSANAQSLTLEEQNGQSLVMERQNVVRLGGLGSAMSAIYSGRSSWEDVKSLRHRPANGAARVKVVTQDGKRYDGKLAETTDSTISVLANGQVTEVPKVKVSQVFCIRFKPMTARTAYAGEELFVFKIFDPALWPYFLGTAPKIAVLLYDSSVPEENSALVCKNHGLIR